MNTNIHLRDATPEDIPIILQFIQALAEYEKLANECNATIENVREMLFGSGRCASVLLAFAQNQPAGFAVYYFTWSTFRARQVLYLEDLFVYPHLRAHGIGKTLFLRLLHIARQENCARFEWSVLDWNREAMDFFESLGAGPVREWIRYRLDQEQIENITSPPPPGS